MDVLRLQREVIFKAVRSRGPGGQNVNKVSSAALLIWYFEYSDLLTEEEKRRLREKAANSITSEGTIQLRSDEFRDLERNKKRCLEKLVSLVRASLFVPKKRKATKPTRSSKIKRRESKARHSDLKKSRKKDWD